MSAAVTNVSLRFGIVARKGRKSPEGYMGIYFELKREMKGVTKECTRSAGRLTAPTSTSAHFSGHLF